ncbi:hypothetical protein JF540_22990 [Salipiger thiooxidans]|uniref:hypothetical protein n=1 Tax=Salipiger thiooxidans TaxID=282683 RepID=UPI001A8E3104|nr:hypothetical protein [Salipiger thiooxidans]MBN8189556.1 hypothetical protein [Salipiger thiooxidans]
MSRALSLNARTSVDAPWDDDYFIVLMEFDHPDLDEPLRFSTDPTERISAEPYILGTRSSWRGANPSTEYWQFVAASLELPSDQEDVPAAVRLTIDLFDASVPTLLRSFTTRASANIAIVMASDPDTPEQQFLGLEVTAGRYGTQISIEASRKPVEEEGAPMDIIGKQRFPGLFR